jgi:hypothetical protein
MANQSAVTQANIWAFLKDAAQNNVVSLVIPGPPSNGALGTAVGLAGPGSTCVDLTTGTVYYNSGTMALPVWSPLSLGAAASPMMSRAAGTIRSANIVGTGVGQLGHAQGVVLVPAPAAGIGLQFMGAGVYYTFGGAAYTGGGTTSVNYGAGGAALTGTLAYLSFIGAAVNKANQFTPLAAAAVPVVSAVGLNLVMSAAPTQPGGATGTISWEVWYRTLAVGF